MADARSIILHQYESSPFSEKVRLALRIKNLAWCAVDVPVIMPKPDLIPLTGGYRRTPVMQIGADIYCDTAIILRELEKRFLSPTLSGPAHDGVQAMVASWADRQWFQTSVGIIFGTLGDAVPEAFRRDREELSGRPFDVEAMKGVMPLLLDQWMAMLMWIEEMLESGRGAGAGAWLGGHRPGLIDIHAHMNIWFLSSTLKDKAREMLEQASRTADWYERLNEFKGQTPEALPGEEALSIAKAAAPRLVAASVSRDMQGLVPGDRVAVAPDDYGRDWVEGELVQASAQRVVIQRVDARAETVHVHFPRAGFLVRKV